MNTLACKKALQTLNFSVWGMAALSALAESGVIEALQASRSLSELAAISQMPEPILRQSLQLVVELGFIVDNQSRYTLAPDVTAWISEIGIERFIAQLRVTSGLTNEFIQSARNKSLKTGWHYEDEFILNAQGAQSEYIVTDYILQDKELIAKLKQSDAKFLDVGAGVAKITLRLCAEFPNLHVVALEPAPKPHQLASINIANSAYAERIHLRREKIQDIDDENQFDVVWYPQIFFSHEVFIAGLQKIITALKPGGMLLTTAIASDKASLATSVRQLQGALFGGLRSLQEVDIALGAKGFNNLHIYPDVAGYHTITGCK
jgi:precorrin-6B methylase 2